nr:uncharacterized protein LOC103784824 isoform X1 [Pan paniscus]
MEGALIKWQPLSLAPLCLQAPNGLYLGPRSLRQCRERNGRPTSCRELRNGGRGGSRGCSWWRQQKPHCSASREGKETFGNVWRHSWHLVGGGQDAAKHPPMHRTDSTTVIQPEMSIVQGGKTLHQDDSSTECSGRKHTVRSHETQMLLSSSLPNASCVTLDTLLPSPNSDFLTSKKGVIRIIIPTHLNGLKGADELMYAKVHK